MFNKSGSQSRGRSTVENAFGGLATVLALLAALAVSIPIFETTFDPAYDYIRDATREEILAQIGAFAFSSLCTAAVFYICKIFIVISFTLIASRIVMLAV